MIISVFKLINQIKLDVIPLCTTVYYQISPLIYTGRMPSLCYVCFYIVKSGDPPITAYEWEEKNTDRKF